MVKVNYSFRKRAAAAAEEAVNISIEQIGFLVVPYESYAAHEAISTVTNTIWKYHVMDRDFVVRRRATKAEWKKQLEILRKIPGVHLKLAQRWTYSPMVLELK